MAIIRYSADFSSYAEFEEFVRFAEQFWLPEKPVQQMAELPVEARGEVVSFPRKKA